MFSNPALELCGKGKGVQKHSLPLFILLYFPSRLAPSLFLVLSVLAQHYLQDLKLRWKVWGKKSVRKHPFLCRSSPYLRIISYLGKGAASGAAVLMLAVSWLRHHHLVKSELTLFRLLGGS